MDLSSCPLGRRRCGDVESTSTQRRNNSVCPVPCFPCEQLLLNYAVGPERARAAGKALHEDRAKTDTILICPASVTAMSTLMTRPVSTPRATTCHADVTACHGVRNCQRLSNSSWWSFPALRLLLRQPVLLLMRCSRGAEMLEAGWIIPGIMRFLILCALLSGNALAQLQRNETDAADLIDQLMMRANTRVRPHIYGHATTVECGIYIQSIGSLNEVDMDYDLDIYLRQRWDDPRLIFDTQSEPVMLHGQHADTIWTPDVFFPNLKKGEFHDVTKLNRVIKIFPNGTVWMSNRMLLLVDCPMKLLHFPLDYQDCSLKISSYAYNHDELKLVWEEDPSLEMNTMISLPQFSLLNTTQRSCKDIYKTGEFSCLMLMFHFKRNVGYYVLQGYVPSILIVCLSWLSFWIHRDAVPARITLGVTTLLTMTTQLSSSRSSSMKVSYPKALDVWYAFCMIIVFGALLEYTVVNVLSRREKGMRLARARRQQEESTASPSPPHSEAEEMDEEMPTNQPVITHYSPHIAIPEESLASDSTDLELQPIHIKDEKACKDTQVPNSHESGCRRPRFQGVTSSIRKFPSVLWRQLDLCGRVSTSKKLDEFSRVFFPAVFLLFNVCYWVLYTQPIVFIREEGTIRPRIL